MITIPDPPALHPCAGCLALPLWLYSPRKSKWVPFVADGPTLRVHDCTPRHRGTPPDLTDLRAKFKADAAKYRETP